MTWFKSEQAMPDEIDAMEDTVDQMILMLLQQVDAIASKLWENSITESFPETHQIPFLIHDMSYLIIVTTARQHDDNCEVVCSSDRQTCAVWEDGDTRGTTAVRGFTCSQ